MIIIKKSLLLIISYNIKDLIYKINPSRIKRLIYLPNSNIQSMSKITLSIKYAET